MNKLLFTSLQKHNMALLFHEDILVDFYSLDDVNHTKVGSIYIGKVKNIVANIDACFVEISPGELCFLPLKDAKSATLLNRSSDGRILEGDELMVQVVRDAIKTKQAAVTTKIDYSNDYFAITVGEKSLGISNKISVKKKNALKQFLMDSSIIDQSGRLTCVVKNNNEGYGLVLRTACAKYVEEQGFESLLEALKGFLEEFQQLLLKATHGTCYSCLKTAKTSLQKAFEYFSSDSYEEILTDDEDIYEELKVMAGETKLVRKYEDKSYPLVKLYSIESRLKDCLKPYVWLKSGANLVIEQTECLNTIDINSGKYDKKTTTNKTNLEINLEACKEIARQIRIRNLSGIIIVDFINMANDSDKELVLETLRKYVSFDKIPTCVVDMTPLGLVEVTRKKINPSLKEQLSWL